MLDLSVLLALLSLGVMARNLDRRHDLMAVDTAASGSCSSWCCSWSAGQSAALRDGRRRRAGAGLYPGALRRQVDRCAEPHLFFRRARRQRRVAVHRAHADVEHGAAMVQGTADLYPEFGAKLSAIVLSAVLILELLGRSPCSLR